MTLDVHEIKPGNRLPAVSHKVLQKDMQQFEVVVWDRGLNVHNDEATATREGLDRPIASGQHQMAFVHEMLEGAFGVDWVTGGRIKLRYLHPVYDEDVLTAYGQIASVKEYPDTRRHVTVDVWCEKESGVKTAAGVVHVAIPIREDSSSTRQPDDPARTSGPLEGIRVLELSHAWAGPYTGMMLADMGADVVKVERPGQDPEARGGYPYIGQESVPFILLHRNKKSITLDLKSERGKEILLTMVATADVVIENFRPGTLDKLGLGYGALSAANPAIIVASITGFGFDAGGDRQMPGVNLVAQAVNGMAATSGGGTGKPAPLGTALCDMVAGMWTAHGILCALLERQKTGKGQQVDCSLVQAGLSLMHAQLAISLFGRKDWESADRQDLNAPSGFYRTSDNRHVAIFASYPKLWAALVEALDLSDISLDERFATRRSRTTNAADLRGLLEPIIAERTLQHWLETLERAGVPVAPLMDLSDALRSGQDYIWDAIQVLRHPTSGAVPIIRSPVRLSRTPGAITQAAPLLGEHTDKELSHLGLGDELPELRAAGVI